MKLDLTNFNKIPADKQKMVINAGFLCFGQNGYNKTSVADIANAAGISKASLFQYFGNKRDMYLFLYDFAGKEVVGRIPEGTDDYFECSEMYVKSLAAASNDYPNLFAFLVLQSQRKDFSEEEGILEVANEVCEFNANTLYDKVDWSKFKEAFDKTTVQNIFNWLSTGCITQLSLENGESFMYLGRNYSLRITNDENIKKSKVRLYHGKFYVAVPKNELLFNLCYGKSKCFGLYYCPRDMSFIT